MAVKENEASADPMWTVVHPRSGEAESVEQMNLRMMAFHPALEEDRREDHSIMHKAKAVMEGDTSVADLFRRIGELERLNEKD